MKLSNGLFMHPQYKCGYVISTRASGTRLSTSPTPIRYRQDPLSSMPIFAAFLRPQIKIRDDQSEVVAGSACAGAAARYSDLPSQIQRLCCY